MLVQRCVSDGILDASHRHGLDVGTPPGSAELRRFLAVKLQAIGPQGIDYLPNPGIGFVEKQRGYGDEGRHRGANLQGGLEVDCIRAAARGVQRVFEFCQAADLDARTLLHEPNNTGF